MNRRTSVWSSRFWNLNSISPPLGPFCTTTARTFEGGTMCPQENGRILSVFTLGNSWFVRAGIYNSCA